MKFSWPIKTKIKGVTYENRQDTCARLYQGASLNLIREPNNPKDRNAIAVYYGSNSCGYLDKSIALDLALNMDQGMPIEATVTSIKGGNGLSIGVEIELKLKTPKIQISSVDDEIETIPSDRNVEFSDKTITGLYEDEYFKHINSLKFDVDEYDPYLIPSTDRYFTDEISPVEDGPEIENENFEDGLIINHSKRSSQENAFQDSQKSTIYHNCDENFYIKDNIYYRFRGKLKNEMAHGDCTMVYLEAYEGDEDCLTSYKKEKGNYINGERFGMGFDVWFFYDLLFQRLYRTYRLIRDEKEPIEPLPCDDDYQEDLISQRYIGEFVENRYHGEGKVEFYNFEYDSFEYKTYLDYEIIGNFQNGKIHTGKIIWHSSLFQKEYTGALLDYEPNGHGVLKFDYPSNSYKSEKFGLAKEEIIGEFKKGEINGVAKLIKCYKLGLIKKNKDYLSKQTQTERYEYHGNMVAGKLSGDVKVKFFSNDKFVSEKLRYFVDGEEKPKTKQPIKSENRDLKFPIKPVNKGEILIEYFNDEGVHFKLIYQGDYCVYDRLTQNEQSNINQSSFSDKIPYGLGRISLYINSNLTAVYKGAFWCGHIGGRGMLEVYDNGDIKQTYTGLFKTGPKSENDNYLQADDFKRIEFEKGIIEHL